MRVALWLVLLAPLGCGFEETVNPRASAFEPPYVPPPETCDPLDLDDPEAFTHCSLGSGVFGTWVVDERGHPGYFYGLDQHADERALFFNTEGIERRDHWFAFGNHRVNAMFSNDGFVEVVTQDRGVTYLNKVDSDQDAYGGGFGYVDDGATRWSTAYRLRPPGAVVTRRFGLGYVETSTSHRDITVTRRLCSPPGEAPVVLDDVVLSNESSSERTLRYYEHWDVARRPIEINWVVSGLPLTLAPGEARSMRDGRNELFDEQPVLEAGGSVLGIRRAHASGVTPPDPEDPHPTDYFPGDPFLATLVGDVSGAYVDQAAFLGDGTIAEPAAVRDRAAGVALSAGAIGPTVSALGQPHVLVARHDVTLAAGESRRLRFAYGYAPMGEPFEIDERWRDEGYDPCSDAADALVARTFTFATERAPVLRRELAWHASQLEVSVGRRDYWEGLVVPQGSAYLYLHGADGAARDLGLFAVPLVYTHPALAKEELRLYMGITHAEGRRFSYAFQGHGMLDDALGLHEAPSDLTLFFLWAMGEYVGATGDLAFLDEEAPYWPRDAVPGATVWDHVEDALRHLFDVVGTGEHGLIRVQTGDWSDGIVIEAPDRDWAVESGESVPNTQMAAAVLPRVADLVEPRDPALAEEIRGRVAGYRAALASTWTGSFFGRGYLEDEVLAYSDRINLEAQVWALIGDTFEGEASREQLVEAVAASLDDPSPSGATLVSDGQIWPAISCLLTWGYATSHPERAWAHFIRNTMAARTVAYPDVWLGIWSGPDGHNGPGTDRPGGTWYSQVTPMTDFPVQNNNQHAMPILAAIRMAGVDATATGLSIAPPTPFEPLVLRSALLDLRVARAEAASTWRLSGNYRPVAPVDRTITVRLPPSAEISSAMVGGSAVSVPAGSTSVELTAAPALTGGIGFEVTYAGP